ncbi:MAG: hypothetical protein FWH11_00540 [Micrococcales bacterium]|nr:hypothetical protein [Micrococcales bacterium]
MMMRNDLPPLPRMHVPSEVARPSATYVGGGERWTVRRSPAKTLIILGVVFGLLALSPIGMFVAVQIWDSLNTQRVDGGQPVDLKAESYLVTEVDSYRAQQGLGDCTVTGPEDADYELIYGQGGVLGSFRYGEYTFITDTPGQYVFECVDQQGGWRDASFSLTLDETSMVVFFIAFLAFPVLLLFGPAALATLIPGLVVWSRDRRLHAAAVPWSHVPPDPAGHGQPAAGRVLTDVTDVARPALGGSYVKADPESVALPHYCSRPPPYPPPYPAPYPSRSAWGKMAVASVIVGIVAAFPQGVFLPAATGGLVLGVIALTADDKKPVVTGTAILGVVINASVLIFRAASLVL